LSVYQKIFRVKTELKKITLGVFFFYKI